MTDETTDDLIAELHAAVFELRRVGDRLDTIEGKARSEWRWSWWHRLVSAIVVILLLGLGAVVQQQRAGVADRCDAIRDAFDTYTSALAGFSSAQADRTPEAEAAFDQRVEVFRAEIRTRLADCD
jgi:hypothetical protein